NTAYDVFTGLELRRVLFRPAGLVEHLLDPRVGRGRRRQLGQPRPGPGQRRLGLAHSLVGGGDLLLAGAQGRRLEPLADGPDLGAGAVAGRAGVVQPRLGVDAALDQRRDAGVFGLGFAGAGLG